VLSGFTVMPLFVRGSRIVGVMNIIRFFFRCERSVLLNNSPSTGMSFRNGMPFLSEASKASSRPPMASV